MITFDPNSLHLLRCGFQYLEFQKTLYYHTIDTNHTVYSLVYYQEPLQSFKVVFNQVEGRYEQERQTAGILQSPADKLREKTVNYVCYLEGVIVKSLVTVDMEKSDSIIT